MSVICQTAELQYPIFLNPVNRLAAVESTLAMEEGYPQVAAIVGGDFTVENMKVTVETDWVIVTGLVVPHLVYHTMKPERIQRRHHEREAVEYAEESLQSDVADEPAILDEDEDDGSYPTVYGMDWSGEKGIPFEERVEFPGLRPEMLVNAEVAIVRSSFEMVGSASVYFRCQMEIRIDGNQIQSATVVSDVTALAPEKINVSRESVSLEAFHPIQQLVIPVQASLTLPRIKPGVARILKTSVRPCGLGWEMNRGRIAFKGFLDVSLVYVGCDDEGRPTEIFVNEWLRESGTAIPIQSLLDGEFGDGEMVISPQVSVASAQITPSSPYELGCRVELQCTVKVSSIQHRDVVTDVSSDSGSMLDTQKVLLSVEEHVGETSGEISFEQNLDLPSAGMTLDRILIHEATLGGLEAEASTGKVLVRGGLDFSLLYMAENKNGLEPEVARWERNAGDGINVAGMVDLPNLEPGGILELHGTIESIQVETTGPRSIRVAGVVKVNAVARMARSFIVLQDCAIVVPVDPCTRPSMLFYVVQPGDTLWMIARRYQTTVDTLARVNQISDPNQIYVGQKLLIPKMVMNL